jgi:hypothetical protein
MVAAQQTVFQRCFSWYFLHIWHQYPDARPYIAYQRGNTLLVSINSTVDDYFWPTINSPRTDQNYITSLADQLLTADGTKGAIRQVLDAGGWPILMTHWQSFFSNGLETGLAVLDVLGERISTTLANEVVWMTCSQLAQRTIAECALPQNTAPPLPPKPHHAPRTSPLN